MMISLFKGAKRSKAYLISYTDAHIRNTIKYESSDTSRVQSDDVSVSHDSVSNTPVGVEALRRSLNECPPGRPFRSCLG